MRWLPVALLLLGIVGRPTPAGACTCGSFEEPTEDSCRGASRVFAGVVTSYRQSDALTSLFIYRSRNAVLVELAVDRVWKGDVPNLVYTRTGRGGGDCGIQPAPGTRFVVCDDQAGDAHPDYELCSKPAFEAWNLEAALGPWRPPASSSSWLACLVAAALTMAAAVLIQRRGANSGMAPRSTTPRLD